MSSIDVFLIYVIYCFHGSLNVLADDFWFGAQDGVMTLSNNAFDYTDGSLPTYTNWAPAEPQGNGGMVSPTTVFI